MKFNSITFKLISSLNLPLKVVMVFHIQVGMEA